MFCGAACILLLSLVAHASAHYIFPILKVNGRDTGVWEYVRKTNNWENEDFYPLRAYGSNDMRCYNTEVPNHKALTYNVDIEDTLAFKVWAWNASDNIFHKSVSNVYMARVPEDTDIDDFSGDGKVWFKIHEISAELDSETGMLVFPSTGLTEVEFTLPRALPEGKYLLRVEVIALHYVKRSGAEWYIGCAQIDVANPGGDGVPGPLVSFPGAYSGTEPGLLVEVSEPATEAYIQPGPALWPGNP
ncbi:hypothetical protein FA15DRAFT_663608 [Coprinopsis marcescibilis]|uniref:lytic cellulose monooxygenase (C4-dehydrogenating) n=1 Tax=Coprinopsis marcescibilis TaxID=230819 RepID=A0A5C3LC62_COPMA|nr:hypothetical protein FA15DRAFT_663608 [Coprinopsis marcescibilis]